MTYEKALRYLRCCFPAPAALSRFLESIPPGSALGFSASQVRAWFEGAYRPEGERLDHVRACARALRRERSAGLAALVATRQLLDRTLDAETLHEAKAEAERGQRLIDERFLPRIKVLNEAFD